MKNNKIYIFVEKNLGHGSDLIYPVLPKWNRLVLNALIRGCPSVSNLRGSLFSPLRRAFGPLPPGLSKRFGRLFYHKEEIDHNCPDPRAKGRSPKIEMTAVFPWKFNVNLLFSATGNQLLKSCWEAALSVTAKGQSEQLTLDLPQVWYKNSKGENQ